MQPWCVSASVQNVPSRFSRIISANDSPAPETQTTTWRGLAAAANDYRGIADNENVRLVPWRMGGVIPLVLLVAKSPPAMGQELLVKYGGEYASAEPLGTFYAQRSTAAPPKSDVRPAKASALAGLTGDRRQLDELLYRLPAPLHDPSAAVAAAAAAGGMAFADCPRLKEGYASHALACEGTIALADDTLCPTCWRLLALRPKPLMLTAPQQKSTSCWLLVTL